MIVQVQRVAPVATAPPAARTLAGAIARADVTRAVYVPGFSDAPGALREVATAVAAAAKRLAELGGEKPARDIAEALARARQLTDAVPRTLAGLARAAGPLDWAEAEAEVLELLALLEASRGELETLANRAAIAKGQAAPFRPETDPPGPLENLARAAKWIAVAVGVGLAGLIVYKVVS